MATTKVSTKIVRMPPSPKYIFAATDKHESTDTGIIVLIKRIKFLRANKISILPTKKQQAKVITLKMLVNERGILVCRLKDNSKTPTIIFKNLDLNMESNPQENNTTPATESKKRSQ